VPGNRFVIYGARDLDRSLRDVLASQMHYTYFPVPLGELRADIEFSELEEGEIQINDAVVRTHYLNHTAVCMGYRIEADGASVAYVTDHEPYGLLIGSTDYATDVAVEAGAQRLALFHHEPTHSDDDLDRMVEYARGQVGEVDRKVDVFAACEGQEVVVGES
jgi:phosphoribosyl 1,2-cyclic phosphodiesterase